MYNVEIKKAQPEDRAYIKEKLAKYMLDSTNASWEKFFVAKYNNKTVAFGRIINHGSFFELASVGVDYYYRKKSIGIKMLSFLIQQAKRLDPNKGIYGVTHRPGFLKKVGFIEIASGPEPLEYKRQHKCKLGPKKNKIMKLP